MALLILSFAVTILTVLNMESYYSWIGIQNRSCSVSETCSSIWITPTCDAYIRSGVYYARRLSVNHIDWAHTLCTESGNYFCGLLWRYSKNLYTRKIVHCFTHIYMDINCLR